jgi:hypothetical protein
MLRHIKDFMRQMLEKSYRIKKWREEGVNIYDFKK